LINPGFKPNREIAIRRVSDNGNELLALTQERAMALHRSRQRYQVKGRREGKHARSLDHR
jgi:hypothetical protein